MRPTLNGLMVCGPESGSLRYLQPDECFLPDCEKLYAIDETVSLFIHSPYFGTCLEYKVCRKVTRKLRFTFLMPLKHGCVSDMASEQGQDPYHGKDWTMGKFKSHKSDEVTLTV